MWRENIRRASRDRIRGIILSMATIRITEAEAIRDIAGFLARAHRGEEIVIGDAAHTVVLHRTGENSVRRLSESLRLAKEHGSTATLDGGFARDLEAVIHSHPEPLKNPWD
jgi:hypothetical protein